MNDHDYTYYRSGSDVYRVHLEPDPDAQTPREYDNLSTLITFGGRYTSPDGKVCDDRGHRQVHSPFPSELASRDSVEVRRLQKYAALFMPEVLFVTGLRRDYDGTLSTTDNEGGVEGVAFVTREDWDLLMGADSPITGGSVTPASAIEEEVAIYNKWASGEYVGFVVERRELWIHSKDQLTTMFTWGDTDSVWGFDDEKYALSQAVGTLPDGSIEIREADVDAENEETDE